MYIIDVKILLLNYQNPTHTINIISFLSLYLIVYSHRPISPLLLIINYFSNFLDHQDIIFHESCIISYINLMHFDANVKEILKRTLYPEVFETGCISTPDCCSSDKSCGDNHIIHANGAVAK